MQRHEGDMLEYAQKNKISTLCFTAGDVVSGGDLLTKGKNPLAVKRRFPAANKSLGNLLEYKRIWQRLQGDYLTLETDQLVRCWLGNPYEVDKIRIVAVQVKRSSEDKENWDLTGKSLLCLRVDMERWQREHDRPEAVLNCPLIGRGGFPRRKSEVFEMVEHFLGNKNVTVFR